MQTVSKIQPIFAIQPDSSNNASNSTIPSPNPTTLRKRVMKKHYRLTSNEQRARLIAVMTRSRKTIREVLACAISRRFQRNSTSPTPPPRPSFVYIRTRAASRRNGGAVCCSLSPSPPSPTPSRRDKLRPQHHRRPTRSREPRCRWAQSYLLPSGRPNSPSTSSPGDFPNR